MKETSKKIMAMSKDKTEECESLMEQFQKAEKESIYYQNKCEEYLASAKDAKYLAGANEALTKEIHSLTKELEEMKSSNSEYYVKMKRLGRIEQEKLELEQQIAVQNEELNKLMAQKYELTHELTGLSKKLKGQEVEFAEKLEELDDRKAMLENELSCKQAEFLRLSEETNATIKELELRMRENEELTEKYETLKAKHSELFVNQEQTSYENLSLQKDLETLRAICNETESSIDSERNDFKRCLKETNSKIEELSRERDNLGHQLKLNHKEIDALKENYRLVMVKFEKQKSQIDAESLEKGLIENKIREMRQVLEDKTKDFQNLEKYLNDVQRDREEEIKQYEADMENMRSELEAVKKMLHEEQTERQDKTEKLNSEKASLTLELEKINSLAGDLEGLLTTERSKSIEDAKRFEEMIDGLIKKDSINTETILRLEANLAEEMRQYKVKFDSFNAE